MCGDGPYQSGPNRARDRHTEVRTVGMWYSARYERANGVRADVNAACGWITYFRHNGQMFYSGQEGLESRHETRAAAAIRHPQNTGCPLRSNASATAFSAASASFLVANGPIPFIRSTRSLIPNLCALLAASFPPVLCWAKRCSGEWAVWPT